MKIGIIHPYQFRVKRGIERFVWSLANEWLKNDIDVHILTWAWPQEIDWGPCFELQVHRLPYFRYYRSYSALPFYIYHLLRHRFDWVMLCHAGYGESKALQIAQPEQYAIIFQYPNELVPHRYEAFERHKLTERADLRIGVSSYVSQGVEQWFGLNCHTIPNGVDLNHFQRNEEQGRLIRKQHHISEKAPILVTTAALEMRKGIHYIIRALPALLDDFPDLQYWVLGEGKDRAALEAEIKAHNLEHAVKLIGQVDNVVDYLSAADIGCLLSEKEAFGISIVEYMACELPVLVSDCIPFTSILTNEHGAFVTPSETIEVATALRDLLSNQEQRFQKGQAARRHAEQHYDWSTIAQQYLDLFQKNMS